MMDIESSGLDQDHEKHFMDYLNKETIADAHKYTMNLDYLRNQYPKTAQDVIKNPLKYYRMIKMFFDKMNHTEENKSITSKKQHIQIDFQGSLGSNFVTPRGLGSKLANQLVGLQGIITKMDMNRSQLEKSVHFCAKTAQFDQKQYPDPYNPEKDFEPGKTKFIKLYDDNNNPLQFQYGLSSFRNIQQVVLQELPQMAPSGLLPQSVNVILQGKLIGSVKPGDRVQMIGIYKLISTSISKQKGIFRPVFLCLSVKPLYQISISSKFDNTLPYSEKDLFTMFSKSIAPSIYGHQQLKKAVLLMLLGGVEKTLENGTHLRGDINVLMIGDPGTAKSQMLRWVLSTANLAIGTTGSGASGVGLTAAVVTDQVTGEKTLQAGAMVLADRGVVCIDQFDKMNEIDRVAVHEVMQQQTVTIAKAGIHCSLNARCSVIAAANPIYGQYMRNQPPTKNIGMQQSLLSRFDLIFVILDQRSKEKDQMIAERVTKNHRLAPNTIETYNQFRQDDDFIIQQMESQKIQEGIYQKSNVYKLDTKVEILQQQFLKKYINYCKKNVQPILTDQTGQFLAHAWNLFREKSIKNMRKTVSITIRSHETLIRLSTAHAKLRQSSKIEIQDCIQAVKLMSFCLQSDQYAYQSDIQEILGKLNVEVPEFSVKNQDKKSVKKSQTTTQVKKEKKSDVKQLSKAMEKINVSNQKEAKYLSAPTQQQLLDFQRKLFKNLSEMKKKLRSHQKSGFDLQVVYERYYKDQMEISRLKQFLTILKGDKIFYDQDKNALYLV